MIQSNDTDRVESGLSQHQPISKGTGFSAIEAGSFSPPKMDNIKEKSRFTTAGVSVIVLVLVGVVILLYLRMSTAVLIATTPADAQLKLSGFAPEIAGSYLLMPGSYPMTASAAGYFEKNETLTVISAESQSVEVKLEPLPGRVKVDSNVSQLYVSINGRKSEIQLPGMLSSLNKGDYQLTFSSYRYFSKVIDFSVEGFDKLQSLFVTMEPAWGQLDISSNPSGAEIQLDGKVVGKTPMSVEVLETGSEVSLLKQGFNSWSKKLTTKAGQKAVYPPVQLQFADGVAVITSEPSDASVTIDGLFVGKTPLSYQLSSEEQHNVKLYSEGYQVLKKEILLQAGEEQSFQWTLKPELGEVQLQVQPANAEIVVNGRQLGRGSQTLDLVTSKQLIEVHLEGYVSQMRTIVPKTGLTQSLSFKLLTEQQHYWAQFPDQIRVAGIDLTLMRPDTLFTMGTARRESGRRSNEALRNVRINKPFYIAKYETTNNQFQQFDREHNSLQLASISLNGSSQPVVNISWLRAAKFCNWLSQQEQLNPVYSIERDSYQGADLSANGYRLPTEAEWAWLARFDERGDYRRYIWGKDYPPTTAIANYADARSRTLLGRSVPGYDDGHIVSAPVGSFPADAKGSFDIAGNVSEWIHDFYSITPNKGDPELNPSGPSVGRDHVIRGASWQHGSRTQIRLSYREFGSKARLDLGFRIARNIE